MSKAKLQAESALNLSEYLTGLNRLLSNNGFVENFVLEKDSFQNKEFDKLVLYHKTDKQKKIEFVDEYGEGVLYYLNSHDRIDCADDFEENLELIFNDVKQIIENKIVTFLETDGSGKLVIGGSLLLELDVNAFDYGEKEREYLNNLNIKYELWSGIVTEEIKLFVIGSTYTRMPAIQKKRREQSYTNNENIIWTGKPSKIGAVIFPIKMCGGMFLAFTALCCLGFLNNWQTFLLFETIVVLTMCIVFPITCKQMRENFNYAITKDHVLIFYAGMVVRYSHKDILQMKVKHAFYERNKKYGTIKVKVRGKRLTSLNNHLYSIPEPKKVCNLIQECIEGQKIKGAA